MPALAPVLLLLLLEVQEELQHRLMLWRLVRPLVALHSRH